MDFGAEVQFSEPEPGTGKSGPSLWTTFAGITRATKHSWTGLWGEKPEPAISDYLWVLFAADGEEEPPVSAGSSRDFREARSL